MILPFLFRLGSTASADLCYQSKEESLNPPREVPWKLAGTRYRTGPTNSTEVAVVVGRECSCSLACKWLSRRLQIKLLLPCSLKHLKEKQVGNLFPGKRNSMPCSLGPLWPLAFLQKHLVRLTHSTPVISNMLPSLQQPELSAQISRAAQILCFTSERTWFISAICI